MLGFIRLFLLLSFIGLILVLIIGVFSDGQFIIGSLLLVLIPIIIAKIRMS